jgi:hypothetical protein
VVGGLVAIYIFKTYLKRQKKNIVETQIFHHAKNIIFKKYSKRKTKNPSSYLLTL